jgi:signal transduction histidine kinase
MTEPIPPFGPDDWMLSSAHVATLLDAVIAVGREIRLEDVLRRVLSCAADLVDARFAALGVLDASGEGLADFLFVGMSDEDAAAIGTLPHGRGLLGELIRNPTPLRLTDLAAHHTSCGFPANHPPMSTFLGVPVRVRGEVFGNLYLTEKRAGKDFTVSDEHLAVALASVAGVAVENSRLHQRVSELAVVEDRERIARELHDSVIQRIFSIGLTLEDLGKRIDDETISAKLTRAAADLDETVQHVRTTVFNVEEAAERRAVRSELIDFVEEISAGAGISATLRVEGDLDEAIGLDHLAPLTRQLFATVRDAVLAVATDHSAAEADITVSVGRELTVRIATPATPDQIVWTARLDGA